MFRFRQIFTGLLFIISFTVFSQDSIHVPDLSSGAKQIILNPDYNHNRWKTLPEDIIYKFAAFTSSFDSNDPTNPGGKNVALGIPEWVSFEIHKSNDKPKCGKRPNPWYTDKALNKIGIAPKDDTYKVSGTKDLNVVSGDFRFVRGHLCPYDAGNRISCDAAANTCIILNAVPQLQWQNNEIWKRLEEKTFELADKYNKVWVITGPVFFANEPSVWLGQKDEIRAAVPDALFKIIIREANTETGIESASFVIPNIIPKSKKLYEYVTSIEKIESLTRLSFLNAITSNNELKKEKLKNSYPPRPSNYSSLSKTERDKVREKLKKEFHEKNKIFLNNWF